MAQPTSVWLHAGFHGPFLFPDEDTLYEIMNGELGEQVMAGLPDIGIRGCAFYGNGFKAITNNIHPIESPDDLKGLKIRTMAP